MTSSADDLLTRTSDALAGEYELLRPLGHGGMATVYLARERALKRLVAIKVLDPELGASPIFRSRFEREVESAAQLQHPNIVPIYRVGAVDATAFYSMGYVDGESLADRMRRERRLPLADALRITREIAGALGAAHRRGIVHRDVKPQNVLLERESGRALVTDFGICAVIAAERADDTDPDGDRLTGLGMVMGTPRYMSPEQASGHRDLTPASDLYSLGVLLYEMISGEFPYSVATPPNYMLAHVTQPAVPLVSRVGDVPLEVESIVNRLLAKDPAERFADADELVAALDDAVSAVPGLPRRTSQPARPPQRRLRRAGLAALALAVLVVVAVAIFGRNDDERAVDPRKSILIGFFQNLTGDPSLEWLRVGGVEYLAQSLGRWHDLSVVDAERLLDLARRADLPDGATLSREDALRLARAAGMHTATVGTVLPGAADTLRLTVRVYDVASGELVTTATVRAAGEAALPAAFTSLADQLLSLAGAPTGALQDVEPPTRSIEAYRAYVEGIEARSRWDIAEAITAFRRAVEADSSFALAYYELSQAVLVEGGATPDAPFVALADSALKWAEARPEKERLLIQAYHALMHADMPLARERYEMLIALDSTIADAWSGLGDAAWLDHTLRTDARGREYFPADLTLALRAYERALHLAATDHRIYPQLANLLIGASLDRDRVLAGYREPPPGNLQTINLRTPARFYATLMVGDSLVTVPSESLTIRYGARVDSLRGAARIQARDILERWLAVAPDEGQAYLWLSALEAFDRDYDAALRSLAIAESLGVSESVPLALSRLGLFLEARNWQQAAHLGDSLLRQPEWGPDAAPRQALMSGPIANWLLVSGRPQAAIDRAEAYYAAVRQFDPAPRLLTEMPLTSEVFRLRVEAGYGLLDRAAAQQRLAAVERRIEAAPEDQRERLRELAGWGAVVSSAFVGDTAGVRRWRALSDRSGRAGLDAFAALLAGDRRDAERRYAAAVSDTSRSPTHFFALGRTAEGLGRAEEALRWYAAVDSVGRVMGAAIDPDWPLVARAHAHAGGAAEALGRTDEARRAYQTALDLWRSAEPSLREQREAVARELGELDRADRPDRPR